MRVTIDDRKTFCILNVSAPENNASLIDLMHELMRVGAAGVAMHPRPDRILSVTVLTPRAMFGVMMALHLHAQVYNLEMR